MSNNSNSSSSGSDYNLTLSEDEMESVLAIFMLYEVERKIRGYEIFDELQPVVDKLRGIYNERN